MRRMDIKTARMLNALTSDFYVNCAASFAQTRTRPWHGWERCINAIPDALAKPELSVLDLGCGTLRFEDFLQANTRARLNIYGVDACPQLLAKDHDVHFIDMDIVSKLWDGTFRSCLHDVPECDISCAFGLMHHIPGAQAVRRFSMQWSRRRNHGDTFSSRSGNSNATRDFPARHVRQPSLRSNVIRICSSTRATGYSIGKTSSKPGATVTASPMPRSTRSSVM